MQVMSNLENFIKSKDFKEADCIMVFNPIKEAIYFIEDSNNIRKYSKNYNGKVNFMHIYNDFKNYKRMILIPIKNGIEPKKLFYLEDLGSCIKIIEIDSKLKKNKSLLKKIKKFFRI